MIFYIDYEALDLLLKKAAVFVLILVAFIFRRYLNYQFKLIKNKFIKSRFFLRLRRIFTLIDNYAYKFFTNPSGIFISMMIVTASLMLWHPVEIYFKDPVNLFLTKKNTFEQLPKWYVFFSQGFTERILLSLIAYYCLRRMLTSARFFIPFLVYNVWRIFEYWLFAFTIDRYTVILTTLIISGALYGAYTPRRKTN